MSPCVLSRYYACVCGYEDLVQYLLTSGRRNRTLGESGKLFNSTSVSCCWWKKQIIVSGGFLEFFFFFNLFIDLFNLSLILLHVHTGVSDTSIDGR